MNTTQFTYKGKTFALDVDDLAVDARIEEAFERLMAGARELDGQKNAEQSKARGYIDLLKAFYGHLFAREDAGALLMEGVTRLSQVVEDYGKVCEILGEMRALAFKNAHNAMVAAVSAAKKKGK